MADARLILLQILLYGSPLVFALVDQQIIKAQPGLNVTLPCQAPTSIPDIAAKWTRPDLGSDYVIFDRNGEPDDENQHPTFKNRVNLQDRQNGDISLVLTNISTNDSGTYECHVFLGNTWKKISTITLSVDLPDPKNESREDEEKKNEENSDGSNELVVGIVVGIVGVVVVLLWT